VRGASALDRLLAELPDAPLRAFVVWEPVLGTDLAPPLTPVLGRLRDARAIQSWDPERILSADLLRSVNEDPARYGFEGPLPDDTIVWDVVAVFGRSTRWERDAPVPVYHGAPVEQVIEAARRAILAELGAEAAMDRAAPGDAPRRAGAG
jgi:hypothetical protein